MRDEILFVEDILENIKDIENFSKGLTKEEFGSNKLKQNAIVRSLEIIGEAAKNISERTKTKYSEIQWRKIVGSRDIFIHAYFGVNLDRIWDIIKSDLPTLKKQIQKIKDDLEKQNETKK